MKFYIFRRFTYSLIHHLTPIFAPMKILGISAFYHDSAAAIIDNGEVIAAAQEERFTRKKHDSSFPKNAVEFCLKYAGASLDDLDAVVFYDKPLLKFERLLETYYNFAPKGLRSFIMAMPVWMKEKLFLKNLIYKALEEIEGYDKKQMNLLFPEHHLSHAASAFYPCPFQEAAILTIDGVGEWATASIGYGSGKSIKILKEMQFPNSLGLLYSAFTYWLGFKVNSGEYKLMGLAPYGIPDSEEVNRFIKIIKEDLTEIKADGSIWLNQNYFNYATGLRMVFDSKWETLFGFGRRSEENKLEQKHCNLAYAIQQVTEEVVYKMALHARELTNSSNLVMAGGVALNCVSNGKLMHSGIFEKIWIQPAAGDAGGALGAAQAAYHLHFQKDRKVETQKMDAMKGSYLGPQFSAQDIELSLKRKKGIYHKYSDFNKLCEFVAEQLDAGKVVGWFQGRMEFGPRALGNRSILGDARNEEMQKKLNLKIKYRESFRPFAPSVIDDEASSLFNLDQPSPYMLLVTDVSEQIKNSIPDQYYQMPMMERLYVSRSKIPAITHIDFSARVQTVHSSTNPRYHKLLDAFKARTGLGLLVNTSFNVRGEPIVCTPEDAFNCFMNTEMDFLVIGNYLLDKKEQDSALVLKKGKMEFVLD